MYSEMAKAISFFVEKASMESIPIVDNDLHIWYISYRAFHRFPVKCPVVYVNDYH